MDKQYARKFEVVIVKPLGDGRFLVCERDGQPRYEIDEETLKAEYDEI